MKPKWYSEQKAVEVMDEKPLRKDQRTNKITRTPQL